MQMHRLDRNGNPIAAGDNVRVVEIPAQLPCGLPQEDQLAIRQQVGRTLIIAAFNEDGHAELEFIDGSGCMHTIWLAPCFLEVTRG